MAVHTDVNVWMPQLDNTDVQTGAIDLILTFRISYFGSIKSDYIICNTGHDFGEITQIYISFNKIRRKDLCQND